MFPPFLFSRVDIFRFVVFHFLSFRTLPCPSPFPFSPPSLHFFVLPNSPRLQLLPPTAPSLHSTTRGDFGSFIRHLSVPNGRGSTFCCHTPPASACCAPAPPPLAPFRPFERVRRGLLQPLCGKKLCDARRHSCLLALSLSPLRPLDVCLSPNGNFWFLEIIVRFRGIRCPSSASCRCIGGCDPRTASPPSQHLSAQRFGFARSSRDRCGRDTAVPEFGAHPVTSRGEMLYWSARILRTSLVLVPERFPSLSFLHLHNGRCTMECGSAATFTASCRHPSDTTCFRPVLLFAIRYSQMRRSPQTIRDGHRLEQVDRSVLLPSFSFPQPLLERDGRDGRGAPKSARMEELCAKSDGSRRHPNSVSIAQ